MISSPNSGAGYHFDLTDVTLWHIRGQKNIYLYPNKEPYLHKDSVEKIVIGRGVEKIPYDPSFDQGAQIIKLMPGDMISWPHLVPHRVENGDSLNVSLSLEAITMGSRIRFGSYFFDAFTRKHLGFQILGHSNLTLIKVLKTICATLIKKTGASESDKEYTNFSFKLDPRAADFLIPV